MSRVFLAFFGVCWFQGLQGSNGGGTNVAQETTQRAEQSASYVEKTLQVAICSWSSSQSEVGNWCLEAPSYLERRRVQELDQRPGLSNGLAMLEMSNQSFYPKGSLPEMQGALEQGLEETKITPKVQKQQAQERGRVRRGQGPRHGTCTFCEQGPMGGYDTTYQSDSNDRVSSEGRSGEYRREQGRGDQCGTIYAADIGEAGQTNVVAFEELEDHDGQPTRRTGTEAASIGSCCTQAESRSSQPDEQSSAANCDDTGEASKARCRLECIRGTGGGKIPKAQNSLPRDKGAITTNQEAENCGAGANQGGYCSSISFPHEHGCGLGDRRVRFQRFRVAGVAAGGCGAHGNGGGWLRGTGNPPRRRGRCATSTRSSSRQATCKESAGHVSGESGQRSSQVQGQDVMHEVRCGDGIADIPWLPVNCLVDDVFYGSWQWEHQVELQVNVDESLSTRTETTLTPIPARRYESPGRQRQADTATGSRVAFNPVVETIYYDVDDWQYGVTARVVGNAPCNSPEPQKDTALKADTDVCLDSVVWYEELPGANFLHGHTEDNSDLRFDHQDNIDDSYTEDNTDLRSGWVTQVEDQWHCSNGRPRCNPGVALAVDDVFGRSAICPWMNLLTGYTEDNVDLRSDHMDNLNGSYTEDNLDLRSGCMTKVADQWHHSYGHCETSDAIVQHQVDEIFGRFDETCPWFLETQSGRKGTPCLDDRWCVDFVLPDRDLKSIQGEDTSKDGKTVGSLDRISQTPPHGAICEMKMLEAAPRPDLMLERFQAVGLPIQAIENDDVTYHNWERIAHYLHHWQPNHEEPLRVITFGYRATYLRRQDGSVRRETPEALGALIWELWEPYVGQWESIMVYCVHPQPLAELQEQRALVVIVEITQDNPPPNAKLLLAIGCGRDGRLEQDPFVSLVPWRTDGRSLRTMFRGHRLCEPWGFRVCDLWLAGVQVRAEDGVVVRAGGLCKFVVGPGPLGFDEAKQWHNNFDRMAAHVKGDMEQGCGTFRLHLHEVHKLTRQIAFTFEDISQPERLKSLIAHARGSEAYLLNYVDGGGLHETLNTGQGDYHCIVERPDMDYAITVMFLTEVRDEQRGQRVQGTQTLAWNRIPSLSDVHQRLCSLHGLVDTGRFAFRTLHTWLNDFLHRLAQVSGFFIRSSLPVTIAHQWTLLKMKLEMIQKC